MRNRIPLHLGDVLVGAGLLLLIGSAAAPMLGRAKDAANKAKCASNLHQIGLAILLYQNDNQQSYPFTVCDNADDPKPVWGTPYQANKDLGPADDANAYKGGKTAPAANDVTAAFYQLMVNEQITEAVFICPSTSQDEWDFGGGANTALNWTNWQGNDGIADHLSYSFQNLYASKAAVSAGFQVKTPDSTFAIASDMNPGGDAVTSVAMTSPEEKMRLANSLNHDREGQNVLFGDGHADFETTPFCGTQHDNIFTAAGPELNEKRRQIASIIASPVSGTDSILLPTATDIGTANQPPMAPVTADQIVKLKQQIQGTYSTSMSGTRVQLVFDENNFTFTSAYRKIQYHYEIIAATGSRVQMTFTTGDRHFNGEVDLHKTGLRVRLDIDSVLNTSWHRAM